MLGFGKLASLCGKINDGDALDISAYEQYIYFVSYNDIQRELIGPHSNGID